LRCNNGFTNFSFERGAVIVAGANALVTQNSTGTSNRFLFWQRSERGALVSKLTDGVAQPPLTQPTVLSQTLQNVDDRYQKWVRNHFDALLGSQRYKQLSIISDDHYEEIELTPEERNINQKLGMSVVLLFGALLASVSTPWFLVLVFPVIIMVTTTPLKIALMELRQKRKITLMSLLSINMIGMWLGGILSLVGFRLFYIFYPISSSILLKIAPVMPWLTSTGNFHNLRCALKMVKKSPSR
jgi:cation transport ATPase